MRIKENKEKKFIKAVKKIMKICVANWVSAKRADSNLFVNKI